MSQDPLGDNVPQEPAVPDSAKLPDGWTEFRGRVAAMSARYPSKKAMLGSVLALAERQFRTLDAETLSAIGVELGIPLATVLEALSLFGVRPCRSRGAHVIEVCTSVSCALRGGEDLLRHLERRLGISPGEITRDRRFSLRDCGCLGACDKAPAALIDGELRGGLSLAQLDAILEALE